MQYLCALWKRITEGEGRDDKLSWDSKLIPEGYQPTRLAIVLQSRKGRKEKSRMTTIILMKGLNEWDYLRLEKKKK